jgi:mono/diheme cytochrome c family protein
MKKSKKINFFITAAFLAGTVYYAPSFANAESSADNYHLYCVQCHGTQKSGGGINAGSLSVQPRNHASAVDMGKLSDENIALAIKKGGAAVSKSTFMPPWGGILTDDEIKDMVKYLRDACKCTYVPSAQ